MYDDMQTGTETYSDYEFVSRMVTIDINNAVSAYSDIRQARTSHVKTSPEERTRLRADILKPALMMMPELRADRRRGNSYADEILDDWEGEDGYIDLFRRAEDVTALEWIGEFVRQIRRVGYETGYLDTGSTQMEPQDDEVQDLLDGMER